MTWVFTGFGDLDLDLLCAGDSLFLRFFRDGVSVLVSDLPKPDLGLWGSGPTFVHVTTIVTLTLTWH